MSKKQYYQFTRYFYLFVATIVVLGLLYFIYHVNLGLPLHEFEMKLFNFMNYLWMKKK